MDCSNAEDIVKITAIRQARLLAFIGEKKTTIKGVAENPLKSRRNLNQ